MNAEELEDYDPIDGPPKPIIAFFKVDPRSSTARQLFVVLPSKKVTSKFPSVRRREVIHRRHRAIGTPANHAHAARR